MKTYEEIKTELDILVEEYVLLKRDTSLDIPTQLTSDIDKFLDEKVGSSFSIEGNYIWYKTVDKYDFIFNKSKDIECIKVPLEKLTNALKDKYK